jgi:hypothetical protein
MPLDLKTLGSGTPRTLDGRRYPNYLRAYERHDEELLALVEQLGDPTLNKLVVEARDPQMRSVISPWVASAEWRGLLDRVDPEAMVGNRRYRLTERGQRQLAQG